MEIEEVEFNDEQSGSIEIEEKHVTLLFNIVNQIKFFYETPVIFFTKKDFSDIIFNTLCTVRRGLMENDKKIVIDAIIDFHIQWLYAVGELEKFKSSIRNISKENIYNVIEYTMSAMCSRLKYFQRYIEKHKSCLSNNRHREMRVELELVEDMHKAVAAALLDHLLCFKNFTGNAEFIYKTENQVEELLEWLDKINDEISKLLGETLVENDISRELARTYQQIIESFMDSNSTEAQRVQVELGRYGKQIGTLIRYTKDYKLEMSLIYEKINMLEDRIKSLHKSQTSAKDDFEYQKMYLQKRLDFIENSKTTIKILHGEEKPTFENIDVDDVCPCKDHFELRIFQHLLPLAEREHLVTELCYLWDFALTGTTGRRSISTLYAAEVINYTDDIGSFTVDKYGRKIYYKPDDETKYQVNEEGDLVPLDDDDEHVYFYDKCGRYYIDDVTGIRFYKAHDDDSEYMMDSNGILLKTKEVKDGTTFYYNNLGRYYINKDGKRIYREVDALSEYECDGLGNLVRVRSHTDLLIKCPENIQVTEDFKYLKLTVGKALRECIASVILSQPKDPIKYLSDALMHYRDNMESRDARANENEQLEVERSIKMAEEQAEAERLALELAMLEHISSEATSDSYLKKYNTLMSDRENPPKEDK